MTSARLSASDRPDVDALLSSLAGVLSAHVVRGPGGRLVEIHILSSAALHPKQMVRNVESALRAGLGIDVDRRIISVAQVRTPETERPSSNGEHPAAKAADSAPSPAPSPAPAGSEPEAVGPVPGWVEAEPESPEAGPETARGRLEFVRYHSRRQDGRCTCQVVLRDDSDEVTGTGSGPDTAAGRAEAAARAVLDAIRQARPELRLELDGTTLTSSRGRTFVIAAAQLLRERDALRLAGAATMTRSPEEAAILATLQATNRWSS
jgi:hypothetical protein